MKHLKYLLILVATATIVGCYDDKGNYDYHDINEVSIKGVPENVEIDRYATLRITPDIEATIGGNDPEKYTYEWKIGKKVLSTSKDLNYEVTDAQGSYTLLYTVADKETQVKTFATTKLVVNYTTSADGILVVSSQNGQADLSYLRLDVENADFMKMFYNKSHDEPLGKNPRQLVQTFVDGYPGYVKKNGGRGIKLVCDEGLLQLSNVTLDKMDRIDKDYMLRYGELYPLPDYSNFKPAYISGLVSQWRRNPYGAIMNNEDVYLISNGAMFLISFNRTGDPEINYTNYVGDDEKKVCRFSPMVFVTGRKPAPSRGKNKNAGWRLSYDKCLFDENQGMFYTMQSGKLTPVDEHATFPGYRAFYGEDTYQYGFCFTAIAQNGKVKFVTFDTGKEDNHLTSVDAAQVQPTSRFFMLRNAPYVFFNTTQAIYKYNILNVATGIAPTEADKIVSLKDLGYDDDATIADICLHRYEKKMVIAVSRYGHDGEGSGDELKSDIIELNIDADKPVIIKKHTGVCGAKPLVIYKYRTFARNDAYIVD